LLLLLFLLLILLALGLLLGVLLLLLLFLFRLRLWLLLRMLLLLLCFLFRLRLRLWLLLRMLLLLLFWLGFLLRLIGWFFLGLLLRLGRLFLLLGFLFLALASESRHATSQEQGDCCRTDYSDRFHTFFSMTETCCAHSGARPARLLLRPQSPIPDHGPGVAVRHCSLCADADSREAVKEPERVQEPQHDAYDDNGIQDRLDGSLHRNETIHQPEQYAHDNQGQ
jgi:hypothetical protein